jgi:hypothetical protein
VNVSYGKFLINLPPLPPPPPLFLSLSHTTHTQLLTLGAGRGNAISIQSALHSSCYRFRGCAPHRANHRAKWRGNDLSSKRTAFGMVLRFRKLFVAKPRANVPTRHAAVAGVLYIAPCQCSHSPRCCRRFPPPLFPPQILNPKPPSPLPMFPFATLLSQLPPPLFFPPLATLLSEVYYI